MIKYGFISAILFVSLSFEGLLGQNIRTGSSDTVTVGDCDQVTALSIAEVITCNFEQTEKLNEIAEKWLKACGPTEPAIRLKMLVEIERGTFEDSAYIPYYEWEIEKFHNRVFDSYNPAFRDIYANEYEYFNFVPLNSPFDVYTIDWALKLLDQQEKGSTEYLLCLLWSEQLEAFNEALHSQKARGSLLRKVALPYIYGINDGPVSLAIGAYNWHPLGVTANYFSSSPSASLVLSFDTRIPLAIDFGMDMIFPSSDPFNLRSEDSLFSTSTNFGMSFYLGTSSIIRFSEQLIMDLGVATGVMFFSTDVPRPSQFEEGAGFYTVDGFHARAFSGFYWKVGSKNYAGLRITYNYTSFDNDNQLQDDFGRHALLYGLVFRF